MEQYKEISNTDTVIIENKEEYTELVLKVSSCCNLNCDYCYVFNQGDDSYKHEPNLLHNRYIDSIVTRIIEHCVTHNLSRFLVIFHGGEPLMQNKIFYRNFVSSVKRYHISTKIEYGIQTNATLLTQEWIDLCIELDIHIGISIDGPRDASSHRKFRSNGKCAYDAIMQGIDLLKINNLPVCTLSVINTEYSPHLIYSHLKDIGVSVADFLYPDITYDDVVDDKLTQWFIELFDCWYDDSEKHPTIRHFEIILKLLLGDTLGYEMLGQRCNKTICIKTNGNIDIVDSMKVCGINFTHTGLNVRKNSLDDTFGHPILRKYYYAHYDENLCAQCSSCILKTICGGGKMTHRYSKENGFDNPSVYCDSIKHLIAHIQDRLFKDIPHIINTNTVSKISELI